MSAPASSSSPLVLSPDQEKAVTQLLAWYQSQTQRGSHIPAGTIKMGGYAGTGKTTILKDLRNRLLASNPALSIRFVSLTGKAVKVMREKLGPASLASTIHSFIYRPVLDENGRITNWKLRSEHDDVDPLILPDLIINDEASMTSASLYQDLSSFNVPIIAVGDHGQLPPIAAPNSEPFNLMARPDIRLEKIHRQAADNPIIALATAARATGILSPGIYDQDVVVLWRNRLTPDLEARLLSGHPDNLIIVSTNRERVNANKKILATTFSHTTDLPFENAQLICLRNNHKEGFFNGQSAVVDKILDIGPTTVRFALTLDDGRKVVTQSSLLAFNNEKPITPPGFRDNLFDFGYAVTCHKAQGSESPFVFVLGRGFGPPDMRKRWLYTAVTRAQKGLFVIL